MPQPTYAITGARESLVNGNWSDNQYFVNIPLRSLKVLVLLGAACSLWIGLISVGVVLLMGTGASVGWIVAGVLSFTVVIFGLMMAREIRNAIVLPDDYSEDSHEIDEIPVQSSNHSVGTSWQAQCKPTWACPSLPRQSRRRPRIRSGVLQSELRCPKTTRPRSA